MFTLAGIIANAPAELHALAALAHGALHGKKSVAAEFDSVLNEIVASLQKGQALFDKLSAPDTETQLHVQNFTTALVQHMLTVPPGAVAATDTGSSPTAPAPAAA
jgi:hypothetical protein